MPAQVASPSSAQTNTRPIINKPRGSGHGKKTRIMRRRGRGRNELNSDEEIERELGTDSESDTQSLSANSSSESETEPTDLVVPSKPISRVLTPVTSRKIEEVPKPASPSTRKQSNPSSSFFEPASNWSEMVTDETINGPAALPVIDFSELNGRTIQTSLTTPQSKQKKGKKAVPKVQPTSLPSPPLSIKDDGHDDEVEVEAMHPPASSLSRGRPGIGRPPMGSSVRQTYQRRLENDPSYVPTVGEFWNHDDRLMDRKLRSLSPWWQGQWQGRGRGSRGSGSRGRGGFIGARGSTSRVHNESQGRQQDVPEPEELTPVDLPWTHDRFEEFKQSDERQQTQSTPRGNFQRGRGVFRGAFSGPSQGTSMRGGAVSQGRTFAPSYRPHEQMWTKHHDSFLYVDPKMKARFNRGPLYRIKLPGSAGCTVEGSSHFGRRVRLDTVIHSAEDEDEDTSTLVKLPSSTFTALDEGDEAQLEDVFTVRPSLVEAKPIPLPEPSSSSTASFSSRLSVQPDPAVKQQLEQLAMQSSTSDSSRQAQTEEAVLLRPSTQLQTDAPAPQPIQDPYRLPSQSPNMYHSPYGYSTPLPSTPLPPGIAMNAMGMPFEVATGRPVYLSHPPPIMYAPQPMIPHMAYGHSRNLSTASDFISDSSNGTPPMGSFTPPGPVIFAYPRPSVPVEIRSPTNNEPIPLGHKGRGSNLSVAAPAFKPVTLNSVRVQEPEFIPQPEGVMQNGVMMFHQPYPQSYYYSPDVYGYPQYMDMNQNPYEMYSQEGAPSGTVYYQ